ncbi:MAG: laccase domain-containing protein [Deltaproteobacteria bacterium]|nr:laccase domain-containing protein [Deltaproteobacteria bacterium]
MLFCNENNLAFYRFAIFESCSLLAHGVFNRYGSTKAGDFNLALGNGDEEAEVNTNLDLVTATLGFESLVFAGQVHGDRSLVVKTNPAPEGLAGYDALITRENGLGLLITVADCQGVVLYDPRQQVLALAHNGWRGSVVNILGKTVARLVNEFSVNPGDILAGISPSLGPCCAEFIHYEKELPEDFQEYHVGDHHFDFWTISSDQLMETGIRPENIEVAGVCTKCSHEFFSYRRDKTARRFGLAAGLRGKE